MKKLVVLFLVSLMATSAFATIDPDADSIGIYFDANADVNCLTTAPYAPVPAYCIITGMTGADLNAVECSVTIAGNFLAGADVFDHGGVNLSSGGNYVVGYTTPFLAGANAVLFTTSVIPLDTAPIEYFIGQSATPSIPDGFPAYNTVDSVIIPVYPSSGSVDLPVAAINGAVCPGEPVANDDLSFGSVKSLFR